MRVVALQDSARIPGRLLYLRLRQAGYGSGAPLWLAAVLYLAGGLSCFVAFQAVSSTYHGTIYRLVSLPLGLAGFLVFSLWPAGARGLFGWFFNLF